MAREESSPFDDTNMCKYTNYLVLIAIDEYSLEHTRLHKLDNAVRDADAFRQVLMKRYNFGPMEDNPAMLKGYKDVKVYDDIRVKCFYNEGVIKKDVRNWINGLKTSMANTRPSQLLIYFSGHGEVLDEYSMLTSSFKENDIDTFITVQELMSAYQVENECENVLLITDTCKAGGAVVGNVSNTGNKFSRHALMSCNPFQEASDGNPGKGSPFSFALCNVLNKYYADVALKASFLESKINITQQKWNEDGIYYKSAFLASQEIQFGSLPTKNNGSSTFVFELKDPTPVDVLAKSIVHKLNFDNEREYFKTEEIITPPEGKSQDYYIVSAISNSHQIEKLRGYIMQETLAKKLRNIDLAIFDGLPKACNIKFHNEINLNDFFAAFANNAGADLYITEQDVKTFVSSKLTEALYSEENIHHPVCTFFIIENYADEIKNQEVILKFAIELFAQIEDRKKEEEVKPKHWNRLLLFFIFKPEYDFEDDCLVSTFYEDFLSNLFNSYKYCKPNAKNFNKVGKLKSNQIDNWISEAISYFEGYPATQKKLRDLNVNATFFSTPGLSEISIEVFIPNIAKVLGCNPIVLTNMIFF